ncbi:MAG: DNA-formamidopyrimidine glycosylase [Patescibacteria group bacterium]
MPELPEVETIVNDLKKVLLGLKIQDVWSDVFPAQKIKEEVVGKKILKIERKGKNILIWLSDSRIVLIHLKLTGYLLYGENPQSKFIHLIFKLSNGKQLALSDVRKFAKVLILDTDKITEETKRLGPEPLDKDLTLAKFIERLKVRKGKIKQILMDQSVIAGIGNIYSDEILWLAGIHPLKEIKNLTLKEFKNIYQAMKIVLKKAIKARGDSIVDFRDISGKKGKYQEMQYAYQMTGTKCKKKDGGIIKKIKIGGRSAHFCPIHQKL